MKLVTLAALIGIVFSSPAIATVDAASAAAVNPATATEPLAAYRASFLTAKTAAEMNAFIDHYKNDDPDKLIPRAKIRLRTFSAFEHALDAGQCDQAKQLHQRITGYKVVLPFSHEACNRKTSQQDADPESLYMAGVRLLEDGERASARTLFRAILDRFPKHPLALKAADRLARLSEIEALENARSSSSPATPLPTQPKSEQAKRTPTGKAGACPVDLGYVRPQMVFDELRNNPHFAEPINGIIHKAGGLDGAIAELERLIRENERPLKQAASAARQYKPGMPTEEALATRCAKPDGGFCSANYYYHLLKEGAFYYAELLNALRCRKTGTMEHAAYSPAPIKVDVVR